MHYYFIIIIIIIIIIRLEYGRKSVSSFQFRIKFRMKFSLGAEIKNKT